MKYCGAILRRSGAAPTAIGGRSAGQVSDSRSLDAEGTGGDETAGAGAMAPFLTAGAAVVAVAVIGVLAGLPRASALMPNTVIAPMLNSRRRAIRCRASASSVLCCAWGG
jgi:hypothetical protein